MNRLLALLLPALAAVMVGCVAENPAPVAQARTWKLAAAEAWTLRPPAGRFDASALLRLPDGRLLTVNDKAPGVYEILFGKDRGFADLRPSPDTPAGLFAPLASARNAPWDLEGLGRSEDGALLLCEENARWILRQRRPGAPLERLDIDWTPVRRWFSAADPNASFEGVAAGGGRIFVANERDTGRILVVDAGTLRVTGDFRVAPPGVTRTDVHYSDLCWFGGELWVLCREERRVLRVDPDTRAVLASYGYFDLEMDPAHAYRHLLPYGFFEGLAVDDDDIWLLVDNNGYPRRSDSKDARPQLFRCPRPDR